MYKIEFLKAVRKDLRKLSSLAREFIINDCLSKIQAKPYDNLKLRAELRNYWKYSVNYQGVTYRIIYQIFEEEKAVLIIAIGARERFYDRLLRRLHG